MKLLYKILIGAVCLLALKTFANSSGQFNYLGLGIHKNSYNHLNFAPQFETTDLSAIDYNANISETGFRVFVGHQFNNYVAVEAGFTAFGNTELTVTKDDSNIVGEFKTIAGDLRVVGTYPINKSLFIKAQVGMLAWDNEFTTFVHETQQLSTETKSKAGTHILTGVGIAYGFNEYIAVSFDFDKTEIDKVPTENLGISVLLSFN